MPITRKFVAQDQEECQILKMDHLKRFIVNEEEDWQFLFGPNSELLNSSRKIKIAAEFDTNSLNKLRLAGYLYDADTGSTSSSSSCVFSIFLITQPTWNEVFILNVPGTMLYNSYYFAEANLNLLTGANLDGDSTLMIEATAIRLGRTYRDRVYVNHLGVYDSIVRLRKEVQFLDLTKLDE
jgi:hypothetical protein